MKKLLFVFMALLIVNEAFSAWSISGPTSACAGNTQSYTLKGFPEKATNINMGKISVGGGNPGSPSGATFSVEWLNNFCDENSFIEISNISYTDTTGAYHNYAGPVILDNITVKRLGPISSISGNAAPAICNTSLLTYSILSVCKAQNYAWTIPTGWQINSTTPQSGPNAITIKVTPNGTNGGVLKVTATYVSGGCTLSAVSSLTITRPVPSPVFASPSSAHCLSNTSFVQISVRSVANAGAYNWTYPTGWSGPGSKTTPWTNVSFNGVAQKGNVCCYATLSCGVSTPPTCLALTTFTAAPAKPSSLQYRQIGPTCYFYPFIAAVPSTLYYEWSTDGFSTVEQTTTDPWWFINDYFYTNTSYTISVRAVNSCGTSQILTFTLRTPRIINCAARVNTSTIDDNMQEMDENISIYPNPANSLITITRDNSVKSCNIFIYNVLGKKVKELIGSVDDMPQMNVSDLENGIYFLQMENEQGIIRKEKIVIAH